jgi:cysteine desulfurase
MSSPAAKRYYFDWAATAIPDVPALEEVPFGNPSSQHGEGRRARDYLEQARSRCAAVLGVEPEQLYFTSGGTEANAIVLFSMLLRDSASRETGTGGAELLVSAVEHPSVQENCVLLNKLGIRTAPIAVERDGRVTEATLENALKKNPAPRMVLILGVNNETGAVSDIPTLTGLLKKRDPPIHIHSDMVQGIGKIPLDLASSGLDSASLSAHKLGGPRGVGLLYLRKPLAALYRGGGQEGGIRPGTQNTAGADALARCLETRADSETVDEEYAGAAQRWKKLITKLRAIDRCTLIPRDRKDEDERFSPWILQASFQGIPGEVLVRALDFAGFAISTGSACSSASQNRPVLTAMGLDEGTSLEGVRFSQGWSTTMKDIDALIEAIQGIIRVF